MLHVINKVGYFVVEIIFLG